MGLWYLEITKFGSYSTWSLSFWWGLLHFGNFGSYDAGGYGTYENDIGCFIALCIFWVLCQFEFLGIMALSVLGSWTLYYSVYWWWGIYFSSISALIVSSFIQLPSQWARLLIGWTRNVEQKPFPFSSNADKCHLSKNWVPQQNK